MEISIDEKLAKATEYKNRGNELFKTEQYKKAIVQYGIVIAYVKGLPGSKRGLSGMAEMAISNSSLSPSILPQQDQASNELEAIACLNIATCYIKLNNPRQALEHANKSISLKPANWKAHLRKGEALVMLGDCDNARTTLDVARSLTTESAAIAAISNENKKLSCKIKEQNQKMKKAFAGIFSKSVPLDEVGALSDSSAK